MRRVSFSLAAGLRTGTALLFSVALAACSGSDNSPTAPVLPDPETPGVPTIPVASAQVTLASEALTVGESTQAQAVLRSSAGIVLTGRTITWRSSAPAVATVDSTGRVRATGEGSAQITATSEGQSGSATITVRAAQAPITSVSIAAPRRQKVGEAYTLTATARTANGEEVTRPITWRVRESQLASITEAGVLTPRAVGSFVVEAVIDGKTWTERFTSYDWFLGTSTDALLWSDEGLSTDGTDQLQLLGLTCTADGDFVASLSLYGLTAASGAVSYAIDSDPLVTDTWSVDETGRLVFLRGAKTQTLALADRLAQARRLTVTVDIGSGATRSFTWRVSGLADPLATVSAGCRGF
jgi:hypothetical protein